MFPDTTDSVAGQEQPENGLFLELGVNRLARDLFLLTATGALFIVFFTIVPLQVATAERTWSKEARVVRDPKQASVVLNLHLRKDGSIQVGEGVVATPSEVAGAVEKLIEEKPALRDATVVLDTYKNTPSIVTSDVTGALARAGLNPERFYLRFTEE